MRLYLNYLPRTYKSPTGVGRETYFAAIAGVLPIRECTPRLC